MDFFYLLTLSYPEFALKSINSDPNVISKVQLFITDHYYTNDEWFKKYVIKDGEWGINKKLIPIEYEEKT